MTTPAYSRLGLDERRRQLLEAGARVFTERSYDTVSMSDVAKEAGISKGLLYHYFSSKQDLFRATLEVAAAELYEQVRPDDALPLQERMGKTLNAYLDWIEANRDAYVRMIEDAGRVPEARDLLKAVREQTAFMIASGATGSDDPPRTLISAALGWLWFLDGFCLDWLAHRHMTREQVTNLLLGVLYATVLTASGVDDEIDLQIG